MLKTVSFTQSRSNYAQVMDAVIDDREEVVITRAGHEPVVMLALSEYESLKETAYLTRNPANAARMLNSMQRLDAGLGVEHALIDE